MKIKGSCFLHRRVANSSGRLPNASGLLQGFPSLPSASPRAALLSPCITSSYRKENRGAMTGLCAQ